MSDREWYKRNKALFNARERMNEIRQRPMVEGLKKAIKFPYIITPPIHN